MKGAYVICIASSFLRVATLFLTSACIEGHKIVQNWVCKILWKEKKSKIFDKFVRMECAKYFSPILLQHWWWSPGPADKSLNAKPFIQLFLSSNFYFQLFFTTIKISYNSSPSDNSHSTKNPLFNFFLLLLFYTVLKYFDTFEFKSFKTKHVM